MILPLPQYEPKIIFFHLFFPGLPRGYVILKKKQNSGSLILFGISNSLSLSLHHSTPAEILTFLKKWSSFLQEETTEDNQKTVVYKAVDKFLSLTIELKPEHPLLETQKVDTCCPCEVTNQYRFVAAELLQQLEQIELFSIVEQQMRLQEGKKKFVICQRRMKEK